MHNNSSNSNKLSRARQGIDLLSMVVAGIITFFATPYAYGFTVGAIRSFAAEHYDWTVGVGPIWWLTVVAFIGVIAMLITHKLATNRYVQGFFNQRP